MEDGPNRLWPRGESVASSSWIDEIVAINASVHLEVLDDNAVMLIVEDDEWVVHTTIYHAGRVPIRVRMKEEYRHGGKVL